MDILAKLAKLTSSAQFKAWHKDHKKHFLAHAFVLLDDANKDIAQFGFYDSEKKTMTSWHVSDTIKHTDDQEVLDSGSAILKLDVNAVKISSDDALKTAEEIRVNEYKSEIPLKKFFIIQMIDNSASYNITIFTQSFSTINIKIHATDGKVFSHTKQKLMEFG